MTSAGGKLAHSLSRLATVYTRGRGNKKRGKGVIVPLFRLFQASLHGVLKGQPSVVGMSWDGFREV